MGLDKMIYMLINLEKQEIRLANASRMCYYNDRRDTDERCHPND